MNCPQLNEIFIDLAKANIVFYHLFEWPKGQSYSWRISIMNYHLL